MLPKLEMAMKQNTTHRTPQTCTVQTSCYNRSSGHQHRPTQLQSQWDQLMFITNTLGCINCVSEQIAHPILLARHNPICNPYWRHSFMGRHSLRNSYPALNMHAARSPPSRIQPRLSSSSSASLKPCGHRGPCAPETV